MIGRTMTLTRMIATFLLYAGVMTILETMIGSIKRKETK